MHDIHSHILPGVDDGPENFEDALEIAHTAEQAGIEAIVCTPHYADYRYKSTLEDNLAILDNFKEALRLRGIGISIYPGNEVLITPDIISLLDGNIISTLNNSRYILIEMPVHSKPLYMDDTIFKLRLRGLVPVIAHPERYEWIMKNPKELNDIIDKGCLLQLNTSSLNGFYGSSVRKAARAMVKENCIQLIGSDCHSSKAAYKGYKSDLKLLQKITPECMIEKILHNMEAVIGNQVITI